MEIKYTPLHQRHIAMKARMVSFGGWEMPLQYEQGILAEYEETRKRVSLFDTSHMGEFIIEGDAVASGLDRMVTQPLSNMPLGSCRYGLMLDPDGGVLDDLIVYRLAKEKWMVVVNAGTMETDEQHFQTNIKGGARFSNFSQRMGKIDIQGPGSRDMLAEFIKGIEELRYYHFAELDVLGERVIVSRTGYTGELGYEIYFPWNKTAQLWEELLTRGGRPAGLGVRDVLRIEMGYSLYGHELAVDIPALDAGINRFVDWEKDFIGKDALLKYRGSGTARKLAAVVSTTRRSPRAGYAIFSPAGERVGVVSSGTFSPGLSRGVGLGFMSPQWAVPGQDILIGNEKNKISARVEKRPVYTKGSFKQ